MLGKLIITLILLDCYELCWSCSPLHISKSSIDKKDLKWIVEIFKRSSTSKSTFQCTGILIHPKAVLTTRTCVPYDDFTNNVTIRAYNWLISDTANDRTLYKEQFVSKSLYDKFYNVEKFGTNYNPFTILIMEKAFDIDPVINTTNSYMLNNTFDNACIYIDIQQLNNNEFSRKQLWTEYVSYDECCKYFGDWSPPLTNKTIQYNCEIHPSSFCTKLSSFQGCTTQGNEGSPILCPSENNEMFIVTGLLVDDAQCRYQYIKIRDAQEWIINTISKLTSSDK